MLQGWGVEGWGLGFTEFLCSAEFLWPSLLLRPFLLPGRQHGAVIWRECAGVWAHCHCLLAVRVASDGLCAGSYRSGHEAVLGGRGELRGVKSEARKEGVGREGVLATNRGQNTAKDWKEVRISDIGRMSSLQPPLSANPFSKLVKKKMGFPDKGVCWKIPRRGLRICFSSAFLPSTRLEPVVWNSQTGA